MQAFVDLYESIDGVTSELSGKEFRLTQEFYPAYLDAKSMLGVGK